MARIDATNTFLRLAFQARYGQVTLFVAETSSDSIDEILPPAVPAPKSGVRIVLEWALKIAFLTGIFVYLFKTGRLKLDDLHMIAQRWDLALMAISLAIPALLVCSLRYKLLLRALNVNARYRDIVALSMIGMLFDLVSPVSNGGDLVKAVYINKATRAPGEKGRFGIILFSVLLDRILGLFALFTFALIVCILAWPQIRGQVELRRTAQIVSLVCVGGLLGFFVLVSEKLENSTLRKRLMHIIPFHQKIEALYAGFAGLRHHKRNLLAMLGLSLCNHAFSCTAILVLAQGITFTSSVTGLPAPLELIPCLTILPLGLFATTFGPAGGLGGGNAAFEFLFSTVLGLAGGAKLVLAFQICGILFRLTGVPVVFFYKHKGANLETSPNVA